MKFYESVFREYYLMPNELDDYFLKDNTIAIDVIIPLINTNSLFESNLYSFYREIPINRLLIGDGGCTDDSIEIVKKFPRVEIFDQSHFKSQGFSIKGLIDNVQTTYFIYLHADVFLPENWFEDMYKHTKLFDWFECPQKLTVLIEFWNNLGKEVDRSYSGAQMGTTKVMQEIAGNIHDDYLQRNEDIILSELIENNGYKYGKVKDAFHYHQVMNRKGELEPKFSSVSFSKEANREWELRIFEMQYKGIIKYLMPSKSYLIEEVNSSLRHLNKLAKINKTELLDWIRYTNPTWERHINFEDSFRIKLVKFVKKLMLKK